MFFKKDKLKDSYKRHAAVLRYSYEVAKKLRSIGLLRYEETRQPENYGITYVINITDAELSKEEVFEELTRVRQKMRSVFPKYKDEKKKKQWIPYGDLVVTSWEFTYKNICIGIWYETKIDKLEELGLLGSKCRVTQKTITTNDIVCEV